ncbi:MAG: hypothetical protein KIS83_05490 [Rubrivivax sp.]|nr:hypothetical protein [Rubrivivax sp.]
MTPDPRPAPSADPTCAREALRRAASRLDEAELRGRPCEMSQALAAMAAGYRLLGADAQAEAMFESALRWGRLAGSADGVVDLLCALAETASRLAATQEAEGRGRGRAARERARDHAFEASQLAAHVADPRWEVQVLLRISEVLDRCGDRDDALQLQQRALRIVTAQPAPDPRVLRAPRGLADR